MNITQFRAEWNKRYADGKIEYGFNSVAGYTTGLAIEKALSVTKSMDQLDLRQAFTDVSGKFHTLDGLFEIDAMGAQIGSLTPLGQLVPNGKDGVKFVSVYPHETATGKPVYPAP